MAKEYFPEKRNPLWYSQKISELRTYLGLSQAAFAQKIGVSGAAIGQLERGESKSPSADLLAALTSILSVNLDWLLLGEGEMLKGDIQPTHQSPDTVSNLLLQPVTVQYTSNFYRDRLLKGKTPFKTYKQELPSEPALQELADFFKTTKEEVITSLLARRQEESAHHAIPAFISELKDWGALVISLEQQAAHIEQVIEERTHTAKTQKGYACFETLLGRWMACKLLPSTLDAMPDSLCTVVTRTAISTVYVRPGSSKSPGDIQVYFEGAPPEYLLAEDVLQLWTCEMLLTSQI